MSKSKKIEMLSVEQKLDLLDGALRRAREDGVIKDTIIQRLENELVATRTLLASVHDDPKIIGVLVDHLAELARKEFVFKDFPHAFEVKNWPEEVKMSNKEFDTRILNPVEVSNLKDIQFPAFPRLLAVRGVKDILQALKVLPKAVKGLADSVFKATVTGRVEITNRNLEEAIPVVLATADRKAFYNALVQVLGSGGPVASDQTLQAILEAIQAQGGGGSSTVGDGTRTVTTAGTRVQLSASSVPCRKVLIQAHESNTGTIVVGGSTCVGALNGRRGVALFATQSQVFEISDLNLLYLDSTADGDKVNYYYEN